jgi:hypothetical protein
VRLQLLLGVLLQVAALLLLSARLLLLLYRMCLLDHGPHLRLRDLPLDLPRLLPLPLLLVHKSLLFQLE